MLIKKLVGRSFYSITYNFSNFLSSTKSKITCLETFIYSLSSIPSDCFDYSISMNSIYI